VPQEGLAGRLLYGRTSMASLKGAAGIERPCGPIYDVAVNEVFYRREPHWMRRYSALARDNISRAPVSFAVASLYRMGRLFVIRGGGDRSTAHQFRSSDVIYRIGFIVSLGVFVACLAGMWIAWRGRSDLLWLALPVVYVPLTICFVLTNMRYSVTVQPYVLTFVAVAVLALLDGAATRTQRVDTERPGV
jgi:hypothetical protein